MFIKNIFATVTANGYCISCHNLHFCHLGFSQMLKGADGGFSYFEVEDKDLFGCIDLYGNEIIPLEYKGTLHFSNGVGLVAVNKNNKWGCYNLRGRLVIPIIHDMIVQGYIGKTPCCVGHINEQKIWYDAYGSVR